jgi:hypothetical protein
MELVQRGGVASTRPGKAAGEVLWIAAVCFVLCTPAKDVPRGFLEALRGY